MVKKAGLLAVVLLASTTAAVNLGACGVSCEDNVTCPPDGAVESGGDSQSDGGCDPRTSSCIDPTKGVFVSPAGSDGNDGSQSNPLKTIGAGLAKAKSSAKSRVYVCAGTYSENVDIKDPIDLLGGFSCIDWSYSAANDAMIAPPSGLALHVEAATTHVSDLSFTAADGVSPGDSSIAALASASTLTLTRATLTAGKGVAATKPSDIADYSARAADGNPGTSSNGGGQQVVACTNSSGSTTGGAGGPPGGANGVKGQPFGTYPVNPTGADGSGGDSTKACNGGGGGSTGSYGPGGNGGAGAPKLGTLDATGWTALGGAGGAFGLVGEGGGGGASLDSAGGGGGGGAGGCGGSGGAAGEGGGASIALALVTTTATLTQVTLVTKAAGDGAQGGTGQKAQQAGNGGIQFSGECGGGAGGHGGSGGGGGGGAGGVSVGILYSGTAPTIDGTSTPAADTLSSVTLGTLGNAGPAGTGGPAYRTTPPASNGGTSGNAGPAGVAKAVMAAP